MLFKAAWSEIFSDLTTHFPVTKLSDYNLHYQQELNTFFKVYREDQYTTFIFFLI